MRHLDFPNNIQIETTSRCNASCTFCPYPETSQTEPNGAMEDALFESIVDQISRHPLQLVQPFLNNDPLMDRGILSKLALLKRRLRGTRLSITTNGALLRADVAKELAALDLDTIHISSQGLTPSVVRETMGLDAYTVLRNVNVLLDALKRRGARTQVIVTAILLDANKDEVAHLRAYWRSRGAWFYLNPLNDRAGNLTERKYLTLLPFEETASRSQFRQMNMSGCPALYSFMGILWNGDLITCCMDWRRARVLGNAHDDTLYNLWHGAPYERLRDMSNANRLNELPLCHECGDNRFSIDLGGLKGLLATQRGADRDLAVVSLLERLREEPSQLQLGLVRERHV